MVKPRDRQLADRLDSKLLEFATNRRPLPGVQSVRRRAVLIEQMLESVHRVQYVEVIRSRDIAQRRSDPNDDLFDPLKAAILHERAGNNEEAFWLVFLFVHFGKHARGGWRYAREVYGRLGEGIRWDWESTSRDPEGFRDWIEAHHAQLVRPGAGFGNHRKYERLDARSAGGTGAVVASYVDWVGPRRSHVALMSDAESAARGDARIAFDNLYRSMSAVVRFGRLARFDYLTMLRKVGLANIVPPSPYLDGASGPVNGARLLFGGNDSARVLDNLIVELDESLQVGMQVLEDALCNWQKSPERFVAFRG